MLIHGPNCSMDTAHKRLVTPSLRGSFREVARRLAEALGWQLLGRELLPQAAAAEHVPDADRERLDEKTDLHPFTLSSCSDAVRNPQRSAWSCT